jgi:hypothetical protein
MYFLQEAGEPLKLRYTKAPYGPYSENLRHVLKAIEGHFVEGYGDGGDDPSKPLEIVTGTQQLAIEFLADHGIEGACRLKPALLGGINVMNGAITCDGVARAHNLPLAPISFAEV